MLASAFLPDKLNRTSDSSVYAVFLRSLYLLLSDTKKPLLKTNESVLLKKVFLLHGNREVLYFYCQNIYTYRSPPINFGLMCLLSDIFRCILSIIPYFPVKVKKKASAAKRTLLREMKLNYILRTN